MVAELNIFSKTLNKTEKFGEDFPQERVGLIGGSFNPPHIAHLIMAEQARVQLGLDKVYFYQVIFRHMWMRKRPLTRILVWR